MDQLSQPCWESWSMAADMSDPESEGCLSVTTNDSDLESHRHVLLVTNGSDLGSGGHILMVAIILSEWSS